MTAPVYEQCTHGQYKGQCMFTGCADGFVAKCRTHGQVEPCEHPEHRIEPDWLRYSANMIEYFDAEFRVKFASSVPEDWRDKFTALRREVKKSAEIEDRVEIEQQKRKLRTNDIAMQEHAASKHQVDLDTLQDRSRSLTDFLAESDAPVTYAIDQLLPTDGNATVCAPMKIGKTTLIGNLARSFADGIPFLGKFAAAGPASIAIWDYEMNPDQLRAWLRAHGIRNTHNVSILPLRGVGPCFASEEFRAWAVQWLKDRRISTWVLDPAHRAAAGYPERKDPNDQVMDFTSDIDRVKHLSGVRNVIMPIHTGLNGEHARGAARWGDWPDAIWTYKNSEDGTRILGARGRDVSLDEMPLNFDRQTRVLSAPMFSGPASTYAPTKSDRLVMWLRNNPGQHPSKRLIAEKLKMRQEEAATAMESAEADGLIVVQPGARRSHVAWLTGDWVAHKAAQEEALKPEQMAIDQE